MVSEVRFKKTRLLHLGNVENRLIRIFLRNGRLRVKFQALENFSSRDIFYVFGTCENVGQTLEMISSLINHFSAFGVLYGQELKK